MWGALSDKRTGLSFTTAAGPRQRSLSRVRVPWDSRPYLLPQIGDSPNLEGQVPVFISLRKRVAQLYPQALGSLSVASYDSQGYDGDIRPRLHTGLSHLSGKLSCSNASANRVEGTSFKSRVPTFLAVTVF
jgi:hypothetical protein